MFITVFSESRSFRCSVCGAVLVGIAAMTAHTGSHPVAPRRMQFEAIPPPGHPDHSPERDPAADRPMRAVFTSTVSAATSSTALNLGLQDWRAPGDLFAWVSVSASAQASARPFVLEGLPCRTCGQPLTSWDDGRTAYCSRCFVSYPEGPRRFLGWLW